MSKNKPENIDKQKHNDDGDGDGEGDDDESQEMIVKKLKQKVGMYGCWWVA